MKAKPTVFVLTGFGLNCDRETAHAVELAGGEAKRVHINDLVTGAERLSSSKMMVFVGGFSWGDDHGAGVLQAARMKSRVNDQLAEFVAGGGLVLGICNGFQCLVNLGLLPGLDGDYAARRVALINNDCGNFRDDWVNLSVNPKSPCVFTKGLSRLEMPVRHGEGKFYAEDAVMKRILAENLAAVFYCDENGNPANGRFPQNPNGSLNDIAGICDPTGRIFGLMPHPEAYFTPAQHPLFTRRRERASRTGLAGEHPPLGTVIFENAMKSVG